MCDVLVCLLALACFGGQSRACGPFAFGPFVLGPFLCGPWVRPVCVVRLCVVRMSGGCARRFRVEVASGDFEWIFRARLFVEISR